MAEKSKGATIEQRMVEQVERLAETLVERNAEIQRLCDALRSAYAYRETMEGLPPGTLTSKVPHV